eukprot:TRINITY_DN38240_c0_g1_i1.p1 TRINITY_DN38240_c0_g1~~TRINITY_DN38240_c0_g1_i1.p1  ORF type:complete len:329 (+),score=36.48 TRINITY_DN38240_c0_g1_i1:26-988(+)
MMRRLPAAVPLQAPLGEKHRDLGRVFCADSSRSAHLSTSWPPCMSGRFKSTCFPSKHDCIPSSGPPAVAAGVGLWLGRHCTRRSTGSTGSVGSADSSGSGGGMLTAAQELFLFVDGIRPQLTSSLSPGVARRLQVLLDATQAADFGLSHESVERDIGYQSIFDDADLTVCIFTLPAGSRLPLHDHPGMHVFGRLLFGRLRVSSYDLSSAGVGARRVLKHEEIEYGPAPVSYCLSPEQGNLHEIVALEDSAFFDILFPPYDEFAGRKCNYYKIQADVATGEAMALPARPRIDMVGQRYRGPPFRPDPAEEGARGRSRFRWL